MKPTQRRRVQAFEGGARNILGSVFRLHPKAVIISGNLLRLTLVQPTRALIIRAVNALKPKGWVPSESHVFNAGHPGLTVKLVNPDAALDYNTVLLTTESPVIVLSGTPNLEDLESMEAKTAQMLTASAKRLTASLHDEIREFFRQNPDPTDPQVHDFARSLGLAPEELERHIYEMFTDCNDRAVRASLAARIPQRLRK